MSGDHIDVTQLQWPGQMLVRRRWFYNDRDSHVVVRINGSVVLTISNATFEKDKINILVRPSVSNPKSWSEAMQLDWIDSAENLEPIAAIAIAYNFYNKYNKASAA